MSEVIHALLEREGISFALEDSSKLVAGFESALTRLGIENRNDPVTALVANLIIRLAKDGERDPNRLAEKVVGIVRGST